MEINNKLNELILLLEKEENIIKIKELKSKITDKEIGLINNYRSNPNIDSKKKIYDNKIINEYLTCESNINYLIMEINNKFKRSRKCQK